MNLILFQKPKEVILFDGFCHYLNLLIIQLIFKWAIMRKFGFSKRVFILQRSPTAVERRRTFRCPLVILNYTSVKAVQKNSNIPKETAFTVAVETVSPFLIDVVVIDRRNIFFRTVFF